MKSITIAGNIGKDAELRSAGSDKVLSFNVAVSEGKDKPTVWFQCSLWGKRGEALERFLTKGTFAAVAGELTVREHEGKTYLGVNVREIAFKGGGERKEEPQAGSGRAFSSELDDEIPFNLEWR
jgi:single-strand DNA-binding protein